MDSHDHGRGARARRRRSARRAQSRGAARRCACARAARHRDGAAWRPRARQGPAAARAARASARRRRSRARAASSPRRRSRSCRATSRGPRRRSRPRARRSSRTATGVNAAHARYLEVRRLLLIGRLDDAERVLAGSMRRRCRRRCRPRTRSSVAGIAMRRVRAKAARAALGAPRSAARRARHPRADAPKSRARRQLLDAPAARLVARGEERTLRLDEVEALLASTRSWSTRAGLSFATAAPSVSLATRPVLFTLARALAEAWPADATRDALVARAFRGKVADESHRARLRVEIGRLRALLRRWPTSRDQAAASCWSPRHARGVVVLARPVEEKHAAVLALLADGEAWSTLGARARTRREPAQRAARARGARGGKARCRPSAAAARGAG